MGLGRHDKQFLVAALKYSLAKIGGGNEAVRILRKNKAKAVARVKPKPHTYSRPKPRIPSKLDLRLSNIVRDDTQSEDILGLRSLVNLASSRNPVTDYSRPKIPMAG